MNSGYVQVFCGNGDGKSSAAIGKGILSAIDGKDVILVQFMKEKNENETKFFQRLEPEIKLFRFEKNDISFNELSEESKKEEITNIRNGLNYAKKALSIGECDVLILDEVLGLVDEGIIECNDLIPILEARTEEVTVILTGIVMPEELKDYVDVVSEIEALVQK
ncbi:MAG: cob(I)yrinic acid a,c-diamide adenosyltransferase [Lachnospiraceae bacterium]|nr:cob(I)yrinic acid a,c-diamide adenosyltransferase [Lachnospiraceae bacterium]